ncbi:MAG: hypothetical protein ACOZAQ_08530 [Pseudomonadota bacterium]
MKLIVLILALVLWFMFGLREREISHGPGQIAADPPRQELLADADRFTYLGYTLTPLAEFDMTARVLSHEHYRWDRGADLAPVDLVMGWGVMSDETVLAGLKISQSGRWYHWRASELPAPRREIETHSANMHMIPSSDEVRNILFSVRKGRIVRVIGKLVRVDAPDGYYWISSLSREDTGGGACELIWVESISVL